jgi:uncharacterized protein (DUF2249 family)
MNTAQIQQIVSININGLSPSQYTWSARQTGPATYRIDIQTSVSLN